MTEEFRRAWYTRTEDALFIVSEEGVVHGPYGEPYLKVHLVAGATSPGYPFRRIALFLYDTGCGALLCEASITEDSDDYLPLSLGHIADYLMTGALQPHLPATNGWFLPRSEEEFMQCRDAKADYHLLPVGCRSAIHFVMQRAGVRDPHYSLILDPDDRKALTFNLWQSLGGDVEKIEDVVDNIRWCLPSHYTVITTQSDRFAAYSLSASEAALPETSPTPDLPAIGPDQRCMEQWKERVNAGARFYFDPKAVIVDDWGDPYLLCALASAEEAGLTFHEMALFLYEGGIGAMLHHPGWELGMQGDDYAPVYLGNIVEFLQTGELTFNTMRGPEWVTPTNGEAYRNAKSVLPPDYFILPKASKRNVTYLLEAFNVPVPRAAFWQFDDHNFCLAFNLGEARQKDGSPWRQEDIDLAMRRIVWGLPTTYAFLLTTSHFAPFSLDTGLTAEEEQFAENQA